MTNIVGVFNCRTSAMDALSELVNAGFRKDDLSLIVSDKAHDAMLDVPTDTKEELATKGGAAGALFGGALGALIASFTAVGTITVHGAGLLIAGSIVAVISGAGLGAACGGFGGALISAMFAENEAARYESEIHNGKAVVIVHTTGGDSVRAARLAMSNNDATLRAS